MAVEENDAVRAVAVAKYIYLTTNHDQQAHILPYWK
jgi:hypothetical protein